MSLNLKKYVGSICEIKDSKNQLLAIGNVSSYDGTILEIRYRDSNNMMLPPNMLIKISIMNERLGFKMVVGKVYLGDYDFVRLSEVMTLMDYEKREFFRINVDVPAQVFREDVSVQQAHNSAIPRVETRIKNISLSGCYFVSNQKFEIGARLSILLALSTGLAVFPIEMQRIVDKTADESLADEDMVGYGCEFLNYSQRQSDALYKFIFDKQLEFLRKAKG